jgi:hypothetical protein
MKNRLGKFCLLAASLVVLGGFGRRPAPGLQGAWRLTDQGGQTSMAIVTGQHVVIADYDLAGKKFLGARGGTYTHQGDQLTLNWEFFTYDSTQVGSAITLKTTLQTDQLQVADQAGGQPETWQRIDDGAGTPLAGIWRITGRQTNDGQVSTIQRGARKTIKVLSGGRFMWAAINTQTKQFFGSGGGTYTAQNGKYVETLEFFSRDGSRVGSQLPFEFEVKGRDWHHRGKSSKGDPIYEIWSRDE